MPQYLDLSDNLKIYERGFPSDEFKMYYKNYIPFEELIYKLFENSQLSLEARIAIFEIGYDKKYNPESYEDYQKVSDNWDIGKSSNIIHNILRFKNNNNSGYINREYNLDLDKRKAIFKIALTDKINRLFSEYDNVSRIVNRSYSFYRRVSTDNHPSFSHTSCFCYYRHNHYNSFKPAIMNNSVYLFTEGLLIKKEYYKDVLFSIINNVEVYNSTKINIDLLNPDYFVYAHMEGNIVLEVNHIGHAKYTRITNRLFKAFPVQRCNLDYSDLYHIIYNKIPYKSNREFTQFVTNLLTPFDV